MKSTGVIRRIDDLGRIVIPKEIRKNLRIKDGDNLEIFISSEDLVLKKYSHLKKITDLAQELSDTLNNYLEKTILITDNDSVIAMTGKNKRKYQNKKVSFVESEDEICNYLIATIISNSEAMGAVLIFDTKEKLVDEELKIANIAASFIAKYLE